VSVCCLCSHAAANNTRFELLVFQHIVLFSCGLVVPIAASFLLKPTLASLTFVVSVSGQTALSGKDVSVQTKIAYYQ
jgi:hypothetical protein